MNYVMRCALAVGLSVVAASAQLDRESKRSPQLAALVPRPFRAEAEIPLTVMALQQQDSLAASIHARELVRSRPYPAENLSLLAHVQAGAGNRLSAAQTLTEAGKRGWREPAAQIALAASAAHVQDFEQAILRIDALFSTRRETKAASEILGYLISSHQGRQVVARHVLTQPRWLRDFASGRLTESHMNEFLLTLHIAQNLGAELSCADLKRAALALRRSDVDPSVLLEGC